MAASASQLGNVVALRLEQQQATSSCSEEQQATFSCSEVVTEDIELSKPIVDGISGEETANSKLDSQKAFKIWELHPEWSYFFSTFGYSFGRWASIGSLELVEKFAEDAQAELFHVRVKKGKARSKVNETELNEYDLEEGVEYVLKVFKEGTLVPDLQLEWPNGLFRYTLEDGKPLGTTVIYFVVCATLLEDGRYAFLMVKEDGNLRSLIDHKMAESDHGCGPFSKEVGEEIMYRVAKGMDSLHSYNIILRDLRASNVLVKTSPCGNFLYSCVADFESSIGAIGTGLWRAPEILEAYREGNVDKRPELFTREVDIYSYGMMCYEVLIGGLPFGDHPLRGQPDVLMGLVIHHHLRPELPDYVEDWARELLHCCWKGACDERPSFKRIMGILEANSTSKYIKEELSKRLQCGFRLEEQQVSSFCSELVSTETELLKCHWSKFWESTVDCICHEVAKLSKEGNSFSLEFVTTLTELSKRHQSERSESFELSKRHWSVLMKSVELLKRHWSKLSQSFAATSSAEMAKAKLLNEEVFKIWELHPKWGAFFKTFGYSFGRWASAGSLEVGEKFSEGAQAELFHARVKWSNPQENEHDLESGTEWVLKVFKEGTLMQDLQLKWPIEFLHYKAETWKCNKKPLGARYICDLRCATLLEDGRFAFLMVKEHGDLRMLIDRKMVESDHGCGPFSKEVGEEIMYHVAKGMDYLHSYNIIHRDIKASNVLVTISPCGNYLSCKVADFEFSFGVVGTGFWRAPEILEACMDRTVLRRPELFTREADIYSYGMMCYEVLTGRVPFQDHPLIDDRHVLQSLVICHHLRPQVPDYVEDWARELLHWCWKREPNERPSFKEIIGFLEASSNVIEEEGCERPEAGF